MNIHIKASTAVKMIDARVRDLDDRLMTSRRQEDVYNKALTAQEERPFLQKVKDFFTPASKDDHTEWQVMLHQTQFAAEQRYLEREIKEEVSQKKAILESGVQEVLMTEKDMVRYNGFMPLELKKEIH